MVDRVQVIKQESSATGGDDADDVEWGSSAIEPNEDAVEARGFAPQNDTSRDLDVMMSRDGSGNMTFKDTSNPSEKTLSELLAGSGGLTESGHEVLDTLAHNLAETYYQEVTRTSGRVSSVVSWTDSGKTTKVREMSVTRSGGQVSEVVLKQYDGSGTLVQTLTGTVTRSSGQVANISWVET